MPISLETNDLSKNHIKIGNGPLINFRLKYLLDKIWLKISFDIFVHCGEQKIDLNYFYQKFCIAFLII